MRSSRASHYQILCDKHSSFAPGDQRIRRKPLFGRQLVAYDLSPTTLARGGKLIEPKPPPQRFVRRRIAAAAALLLISTYLSTWSIFFFQSIAIAPWGSGTVAFSASTGDPAENPQNNFIQRQHKPPVKSISPLGLHSPTAVLGHAHPRLVEYVPPRSIPTPSSPFQPSHSDRTPPTC